MPSSSRSGVWTGAAEAASSWAWALARASRAFIRVKGLSPVVSLAGKASISSASSPASCRCTLLLLMAVSWCLHLRVAGPCFLSGHWQPAVAASRAALSS